MKFGAHVSIAGGIDKAPERAHKLGCECFQIFTRSPRGGKPSRLDADVADSFLKSCEDYGLENYYVHTPYFINLSSGNKSLRDRSIDLIKEDLERSSTIGVKYIMTHLGSSKDIKRKDAIRNVSESVKVILDDEDYYTRLLLENSAGQGDTVGNDFEELAEIIDKVGHDELFICLDTAHMFAAGYDIRDKNALSKSLDIIQNTFGLKKIKLLHGNDSKADLGDRKDRHEYIGKGKIGKNGFMAILDSMSFKDIDMIVETPVEGVAGDMNTLKEMRNGK